MSNSRWSAFKSGQAEEFHNKEGLEVKAWMHTFSDPDERQEYIERFKLGNEFDMRHRALVHFYGADLIAYKRKYLSSKTVNEFLRIFSRYLTHHLEDDCPPSWNDCHPPFWEELIYTYFPSYMKLSIKQKESKVFLTELKKFVFWLDRRTGSAWYNVVEKYAEDAFPELNACEQLLNKLQLYFFPKLHHKEWKMFEDLNRIENTLNVCSNSINSIFEVKNIAGDIITVTDTDSTLTYQLVDFPVKGLITGMLLDGTIGRMHEDFYWYWHLTEGIYPHKAQKYIRFVD